MKRSYAQAILVLFLTIMATAGLRAQTAGDESESYLTWSAAQAESIGKATRETGKAGSTFDWRVVSTNKAINYKVRATLMTPEVIRAAARTAQIKDRLTNDQTRQIVKDAEAAGDLVVMIEIDPNEGSGVIPLDWRVFLQPKNLPRGAEGAVTGVKSPHLRRVPALSGLYGRNYDYDVFWVTFPLINEQKKPLLSADLAEIQLIVGIYENEARISWRMPESLKEKIKRLSK